MAEEKVVIDGSMGEGGGQILRTALALAMITRRPFAMNNLRAHRCKPGLQKQHLVALKAAREISTAEVTGADLHATAITFAPGSVKGGRYHFDVGSAGSVTLVLQTILPPLMLAERASHLTLSGGTHNPWAPPVDFLQKTFLPILHRMGAKVVLDLETYGFYPAGGGIVQVKIEPVKGLQRAELLSRGRITRTSATAVVSRLPVHIGRREIEVIKDGMRLNSDHILNVRSAGPGNVVTVEIESDALTEVITAFGERGKPAETVAAEALRDAREYLVVGAPVGQHLADQLLLPMALAEPGSCFRTGEPTTHARTNMAVIGRFLNVSFSSVPVGEKIWEVTAQ